MFISVFPGIQGDDYTVHKILQRNFQGERVLFQRRKASTHVLSFRPPLKKNVVSKNVSPIVNNLKVGDNIDFTLRINPAVAKRINPDKERGVIKAVSGRDLDRWLNAKFVKYGFLANFVYDEEGFRESIKDGTLITINSLYVNGTLEVLNPDSVKKALISGIGRAKGFGFGMLHAYDSLLAGSNI